MNPFVWIAAGAAALFFSSKSKAAPIVSSTEPMKPEQYGETEKVPLAVPAGWRRVKNAEVSALPELRSAAVALRGSSGFTGLPYGTMSPLVASDGKTYATWVEQHYHEPGGPTKPWGLHHGVTLLAKA